MNDKLDKYIKYSYNLFPGIIKPSQITRNAAIFMDNVSTYRTEIRKVSA